MHLWQAVKTQMKCRIIRLYPVYEDKKISEKKSQYYLEIITCNPLAYTIDQPKFIVSNLKEKYMVHKG